MTTPDGPFIKVMAVMADGFAFDDGAPQRGVSHLAAMALVVMDLEVVRRHTLGALCLANTVKAAGTKNGPGHAFGRALRNFERARWAVREGKFVRVLDVDALFDWVRTGVDVNSERAMSLLNVAQAAKVVAAAPIATVPADELEARERELKALDRLMRNAPGAITNARGTRRLVHRPGSLIELGGAS